jgi:hypothetical protein
MLAVAIAILSAIILITAGGWTLRIQDWWAFNFLIYLPLPLREFLAIAVLLLVWVDRLASPRRVVAIRLWAVLPLAMTLFWLQREHTWHGDALYKVALLNDSTLHTNPYVWKEPLNSLLEYGVTALMHRMDQPPETAIALTSVVAGAIYLGAVWFLARLLDTSAWQWTAYVIGLFATGSSLLWFGHIAAGNKQCFPLKNSVVKPLI